MPRSTLHSQEIPSAANGWAGQNYTGFRNAESDGTKDPVDIWLGTRPRVVERVDQTMNDVRGAQSVDLAMLTVASRQLRALVES